MAVVAEPAFVGEYGRSFEIDVAGRYLLPNRPWLTLYGLRVRSTNPGLNEQAQIQKLLPYEIMNQLFTKLGPYGLGAASCVCRQWNILAQNPIFWYKACLEAFSDTSLEENVQRVKEQYSCSWKKMFLQRPHLRFDGIYIARNTYLRPGVREWNKEKPVHLVTYFRYLRFWPGGKFRYCTSPVIPQLIASYLDSPLHYKKRAKKPQTMMNGEYTFDEGFISCSACFPTTPWVRFQINLHLRSTTMGANNQLEVQRITTSEIGDDEEDEENVHQRGLAPFVFIPWDKIDTSIFNRPHDIDYHIARAISNVN
eukprot:g2256.t1